MEITLITGNEGKRNEFAALLGIELRNEKLSLIEPQHWDVNVVARAKAEQAYKLLNRPVVIDDSAIEVVAWNGLPGALTSWFLDRVGNVGILAMAQSLEDRRASVMTAIGYCDATGAQTFVGKVEGHLALEERGSNGFGYDAIFIPAGEDRTYAEMSTEEKNAISMRRLAVEKLKTFLHTPD